MIFTSHIIVGATVAQLVPNHPVWAFGLGFASHFLLDSLPHRDYALSSRQYHHTDGLDDSFTYGRRFIADLAKMGLDCLIGLTVVYLLFVYKTSSVSYLATLLGIAGGIFPDALQFVYYNWRHEPIVSLQKFHGWIQDEKHGPFLPVIARQLFLMVLLVSLIALF